MEIKRDKYLNDLLIRRGNGLIKVVTGLRRSGKTYLLFRLFRDELLRSGVAPERIVALALDDHQNRAYRDPDVLYRFLCERLDSLADGAPCYVLLDEVQYAISAAELRNREEPPALYGVLNGLLHRRDVDVYVTGSNSKLLSRDVMTEFRGRGDEVHVFPLSFAEFMQVFAGDRHEGWAEYVLYGGLPLLRSMPTDEQKAGYLNRLFQEVYLTDVVARHRIVKTRELADLADVLASAIGALTSAPKLAATFASVLHSRIDADTVQQFIAAFEEAFLVAPAARYDVKGRRYIGAPRKYYFEDVGLRNARLGFRQVEETHLMENVLFNELRMRGYAVDVGAVDRRVRGDGREQRRRHEVDFVAHLGGRRYYIQSAWRLDSPEKIAQEKVSLKSIGDSFKKIVVVRDVVKPTQDEDGILTMGLFDFLLDPRSLDL